MFESEEEKEYYEDLAILFGTGLTAKEFYEFANSDDAYESQKD